METVRLDYSAFHRHIQALGPDQALFGETPHPRLLSGQTDQPGYARAFSLTSHSIKMGLCTAGTGVITLEGNSFRMETGDLCFVNRHVPNYESYYREKGPYTFTWFLVSWWGQLMVHESVYDSFGEFSIVNQQRIRITNALISTI